MEVSGSIPGVGEVLTTIGPTCQTVADAGIF
jgi:hypothetical protein